MLTQDPSKKKIYKILSDIVSIFAIIVLINSIFSLFGITIPLIGSIGMPLLIGLIFFLVMFKFGKLTKKYGWMFLNSLVILGPLISFISSAIFFQSSLDIAGILEGTSQEIPFGFVLTEYISIILTIIGLGSLILFYFIYYRKYLSGEKTLSQLGAEDMGDEEQFMERWEKKEKKRNKIGIIIIIILILILIGLAIFV